MSEKEIELLKNECVNADYETTLESDCDDEEEYGVRFIRMVTECESLADAMHSYADCMVGDSQHGQREMMFLFINKLRCIAREINDSTPKYDDYLKDTK